MLTHASTDESNEALIKLLTDKEPLKIVQSQTQTSNSILILILLSTLWHVFQAASLKANVEGLQLQRNVSVFLCKSKSIPFIYKIQIY